MKNKYYLFKMNSTTIYGMSFILLALVVFIFYLIYGDNSINVFNDNYLLSFCLYMPYLFLHELFHCISYVLHGASFKNITFGGHIEKSVLCCLCKQNITKKNILISLLYPFFFLGIVTLVIGILINSPILVFLSLANISGCGGDLVMFYHLLKIPNYEYSEYNDPIAFGIYTNQDLSKRKMFGLTYVETKDELKRDDLRKFDISKATIGVFIFDFIIAIMIIIDMLKK